MSCKAWNSPVEYPSTESKNDTKKSEDNMFNPIFKGNVPGRQHPGMCAFAEPELLCYRKPKHVAQNKKNGQIYPNKSHSYHDEIGLDQGINKMNT